MKSQGTSKAKDENIAIIIREMIEEVLKVGRKPRLIKLSEEDYKRLFDYLKEDTEMFHKEKYTLTPIGVRYNRSPIPKTINEFMGLPVVKDDFTVVTWIL